MCPGYLGGAVLAQLLSGPNASRYRVTALVRSAEKARVLRSFGVNALVGSLDDTEEVMSLAAQADIVIECVCCDPASVPKNLDWLIFYLSHSGRR